MSLVGREGRVPDAQERGPLDHEHVGPRRRGQPRQEAFDSVVLKKLIERLAALARQVEQPLPDRGADVGDRPPRHCSASR